MPMIQTSSLEPSKDSWLLGSYLMIPLCKPSSGPFIQDGLIWKRIKHPNEPSHVVLILPQSLMANILEEIDGHILASHDGLKKMKERSFQCYY
jgi:hypothetical protein